MKNKKTSFSSNILGYIGGVLLMLYLGIQSPQVPFKIPILILGLVLIVPSFIDMIRKK